ncbi:FMN-binding negative transcriptional regulator [Nakamurella flavida]|uniref:FMN-binding negative transcriptional regulator n=1 Tax=Nakamurella flavida TaxID=363630 RepID=A0A938YPM3_9ACTN|nr:FMN-binding negative transcriptional regulator [Nakamurella flavida]MBM9476665.1 FMN-binding negative transcriptional regulator [Nakamurella flavida]MDP9778897.1 transcriptional regulator [Nakamurella flavida]
MRENPDYAMDPADLKRLVRENPWATLVSHTSGGLAASHYPVLVDETRDELSLLTHLGRPDEDVLELGDRELLVLVQGPHGYISPSWYHTSPAVPTWNFVVAHLSGVPEILSGQENLRVLDALVDHFEDAVPEPRRLLTDPANVAYAQRIVAGTVGIRLTPTRIVTKAKLSQDKPPAVVERVIDALGSPGPYGNPALAAEMRRVHGGTG